MEGRRLRRRPRPAQRPRPRPGPQAAPAGPAAGVPAPLPRPLHGVRHRGAAVLRQADDGALRPRSPPRTATTFAFDTSVVDWPHYFIDVHCPAVTAPVRRLDELRALRKKPAAAGLRQVSSGSTGIAAFFDMDGTLLSSNVIETYLWVRLRELDGGERFAELGRIASKVPSLVQAERRSRSDFLRGIYREYAGARLADLDAVVDEHLTDHILVPALARRRTPDPRAPRGRPPDRADHRRDPAADPAAARRSSTTSRPPTWPSTAAASAPATSPRRRWSGSRGPPGCSPSPPSTAST